MRTASAFFLAWGLWLGALATMLWIWTGSDLMPALLTGAAVGSVLLGAFVRLFLRGSAATSRRITDSSISMLLVAVGLTLGMWGLTAGLWLILVGAEFAVFGIGGLVRELLATRREIRR
jgi:hypothetical protein